MSQAIDDHHLGPRTLCDPDSAFRVFTRTRSADAFEQVFAGTVGHLYGIARTISRDSNAAEDLVQDTYLVAIERAHQFDASRPLLPWLIGILRNRARSEMRSQRRRSSQEQVLHPTPGCPLEAVVASEIVSVLTTAISRVPETYRDILRLYLIDELSAPQISGVLGRPAATVRTQIARGLACLRQYLPYGASAAVLIAPVMLRLKSEVGKVCASKSTCYGWGILTARQIMGLCCAAAMLCVAGWSWWSGLLDAIPPAAVQVGSTSLVSPAALPTPVTNDVAETDTETVIRAQRPSRMSLPVGHDTAPTSFGGPLGSSFLAYPGRPGKSGGGTVAGLGGSMRQQFILTAAGLHRAVARELMALWFRRTTFMRKPQIGFKVRLRISLSHSARNTLSASPWFHENRGSNAVCVFDGVVELPASGAMAEAPWEWPYAVRIQCTRPFLYMGGDLCVDIEGRPLEPEGHKSWSVEFVTVGPFGGAKRVGSPCGDQHGFESTLGGGTWCYAPGGSFEASAIGYPETIGVLWIGMPAARPMQVMPGIDPACILYVIPVVAWPIQYGAAPPSRFGPVEAGFARERILIPAHPAFLGARFYVQCANIDSRRRSNASGVTLTNALEVSLSDEMPEGAVTTVQSEDVAAEEDFPNDGIVWVSRGPLILFEYR